MRSYRAGNWGDVAQVHSDRVAIARTVSCLEGGLQRIERARLTTVSANPCPQRKSTGISKRHGLIAAARFIRLSNKRVAIHIFYSVRRAVISDN